MIVMSPVGHVQPNDVDAGVKDSGEHAGSISRGSEGCNDTCATHLSRIAHHRNPFGPA